MKVQLLCKSALHWLKVGDVVNAEIQRGSILIPDHNMSMPLACADEHFTVLPAIPAAEASHKAEEIVVIRDENGVSPKSASFGTICNFAVRYAIGRRTYAASIVCNFVLDVIDSLSENSVCCMERDIREAKDYGDSYDKELWLGLLGECRRVMKEKGYKAWM